MYKKFLFFLFLLLCSLQSFAADLANISKIFQSTFWTAHYEERYCGKNIEKLIQKAIDSRVDLNGAFIVSITDSGGFMFGMVNALQARESGQVIKPAREKPARYPGVSNWYHHVVLVADGYVFDYDFTNSPRVLPLRNYLLEMFIPSESQKDLNYRQYKMQYYKLTAYPAEAYMDARARKISTDSIERVYKVKDIVTDFFTQI